MEDKAVLAACAKVLGGLDANKPWMTAKGLKRKLGEGFPGTAEDLLALLFRYEAQFGKDDYPTPIRRSYYPSRKSLGYLWGHVAVVGERRVPAATRKDEPPSVPWEVETNAPLVFLSYTARDKSWAFQIGQELAECGWHPWAFQVSIEPGQEINTAVQDAMSECQAVALCLSTRALGSLWVRKEMELGLRNQPLWLIVDGEEDGLVRQIFELPEAAPVPEFVEHVAHQVGDSAQWRNRAEYFLSSVQEYFSRMAWRAAYPATEFTQGHEVPHLLQVVEEV